MIVPCIMAHASQLIIDSILAVRRGPNFKALQQISRGQQGATAFFASQRLGGEGGEAGSPPPLLRLLVLPGPGRTAGLMANMPFGQTTFRIGSLGRALRSKRPPILASRLGSARASARLYRLFSAFSGSDHRAKAKGQGPRAQGFPRQSGAAGPFAKRRQTPPLSLFLLSCDRSVASETESKKSLPQPRAPNDVDVGGSVGIRCTPVWRVSGFLDGQWPAAS